MTLKQEKQETWAKLRAGLSVNGEDALVQIDVQGCDRHRKGVFCTLCLSRLEEVVAAARGALDPRASAVTEVMTAQGDFREYIALVNPIAKNAFAMRFDQATKLQATKTILTSKDPEFGLGGQVTIVDYVTTEKVCDATYFRAFHVRLGDGLPEAYTKRLWDAKFSLEVDGEPLVKKMALRDILSQKEVVLEKADDADDSCLFTASPINVGPTGKLEICEAGGEWIGYMLSNGTRIQAFLEDVPGGGGLVMIDIGWTFARYTTKAKAKTVDQGNG